MSARIRKLTVRDHAIMLVIVAIVVLCLGWSLGCEKRQPVATKPHPYDTVAAIAGRQDHPGKVPLDEWKATLDGAYAKLDADADHKQTMAWWNALGEREREVVQEDYYLNHAPNH